MKNFIKFKKGFSLVELIVAIVVFSIFVTAMIPAMTKRAKNKTVTVNQGTTLSSSCYKINPNCVLCDKNKCILCSAQIIPLEGIYIDPEDGCAQKECPPDCARCDKNECFECLDGYILSNDKKTCLAD